ncbi:hypothetical protein M011DRAFT_448456 [Sporormia fimetaria CBS 119925]|uniref:Putative gamma-glutamylcyclotransferase n=1 Tax=Sporormia fimetaria CBS 119925 TaxID=1340428 RepID=A0A6A6V555_9PLEO|nr:hypothetical protein M011DRAFT_448456 [Sporormia fimetaria CBS 119925]
MSEEQSTKRKSAPLPSQAESQQHASYMTHSIDPQPRCECCAPPSFSDGDSTSAPTRPNRWGRESKLQIAAYVRSLEPFEPCYMFFYGSLMDPEVLQAVLGLKELPTMRKGTISGLQPMMWGPYPTLVRTTGVGEKVSGMAWECTSEVHFRKLEAYETSHYTWQACSIELEDGRVLDKSRVFIWAGHPKCDELREGTFDLEKYQREVKPSMFGFGDPEE